MSLAKPIYTATIAGKPVRFFKAPSGRPELPWHSTDDLFAACDLPASLRERFRQMLQSAWGAEIKTVATSTGPVVIAPHFAAQGFIGAIEEIADRLPNSVPAGLTAAYTRGGVAAMQALAGDLPPMARLDLAMQAARNSGVGHD